MVTLERPWVDGLTFHQVLSRTAEQFGDHDALIFPQLGYAWNYEDFQLLVEEVALALMGLGIERGEHVGLWAANCPEWVVLQFATARIGAVLVNINPAYRANELAYVLKQADITALFMADTFKNANFLDIIAEVSPELAASRRGNLQSA